MKKSILPIILLALSSFTTNAQTYEWAKGIGNSDYDEGNAVATDAIGNVYITGVFEGTVDFDPSSTGTTNLTSNGNSDCFVAKYTATGTLIWAKNVGGTNPDKGTGIVVNNINEVYVCGNFGGTADFDPSSIGIYNITSTSGSNAFVLKLDASGNFSWAASFSGLMNKFSKSIAVDNTGNVLTAGIYYGVTDFDPSSTGTFNITCSSYFNTTVISKLSSTGSFIWAKKFDISGTCSTATASISAIAIDTNNAIVSVGNYKDSIDFDPSSSAVATLHTTSGSEYNGFIAKLDSNGNYVFAHSVGGSKTDACVAVALDSLSNIYTTGFFESLDADFDPSTTGTSTLPNNGGNDIFVLKLSSTGGFSWVKGLGGNRNDNPNGIALDALGNVYSTGYFISNSLDMNPSPTDSDFILNTATGLADIYFSKLNINGDYVWGKSIGGYYDDRASSINIHKATNSIYTTGIFYSAAFNANPNGMPIDSLHCAGLADIFIHKMSECFIDNTTTLAGSTITANATATGYQWLNCSTGKSIIAGATGKSYTPTVSGNYAVALTNGSCTDTSACVSVIGTGIENVALIEGLSIYPNPTNGIINIEVKEMAIATVYNVFGQKIVEQKLNVGTQSLDISAAVSGVYTIKINNNNKEQIFKLMKY